MNTQTKKITYTALMMALILVMTSLVKIPIPNGYVHLGDGAVLLSAYILGPWGGLIAAGIGSAGADYFGGYGAYMLPTFIAKGAMAFIFGYLMERFPDKNILFFSFPAVIAMTAVYYLAEVIMYGSIVGPLLNVPFSALQGLVGIVIVTILHKPLERFRLTPVKF
ncbi:ECF transporter S component [uncultured Acetobacterium sp.]|uniref:ECF transporter S component n=1 Tax=uncultured Acetobacterium sp. TaxID=217139 RepID=UPI0024241EAB|nr:ECF transporter S component [uncultured Acetobacterium sp.]MBU4540326.1 ECF transporter S component [Bacillota bacterium]MDP2842944.1 ECF transporter S component [Acetobacterium sp.]